MTDLDSIREIVYGMVNRSESGQLTLVKRENWCAVPVESACHLDESDRRALLRCMEMMNLPCVYVLLLGSLQHVPLITRLERSDEQLQKINSVYGHFNCVVVPEEGSWALICTLRDYYVVVGEEQMVASVLGKSINAARDEFKEYAGDSSWDEADRRKLCELSRALSDDYGRLMPDQSVVLQ